MERFSVTVVDVGWAERGMGNLQASSWVFDEARVGGCVHTSDRTDPATTTQH